MQIAELKSKISTVNTDTSLAVYNKATKSIIPIQKVYHNEPFDIFTIEINYEKSDTVYFDDTTEEETIEIYEKLSKQNLVSIKEIIEETGMEKNTVYNFFNTTRKNSPIPETIRRISGAISTILIRKKKDIEKFFEDFLKKYEKFY